MLHAHMLRTVDNTSADFESSAWWLRRRSRKLLDSSVEASAGGLPAAPAAVQGLQRVAGVRPPCRCAPREHGWVIALKLLVQTP